MASRTVVRRIDVELLQELEKIRDHYKIEEGVDISLTDASRKFVRNYKRGFDGFGRII